MYVSQAVPGPGKYEIKSQFSAKPIAISQLDEPIVHPPFGTQSRVRHKCSWYPIILGFHSRDETAMLVYKTMAKCRSRFA